MNNEDFFDILSSLPDDIIADAALSEVTADISQEVFPTELKEDTAHKNIIEESTFSHKNEKAAPLILRHKSTIKNMLLIAACVALFAVSGFIVSDNIKTGNMGLFETEKHPSDTAFSDNADTTYFYPPEKTSTEEKSSDSSESTSSEMLTTNVFTPPPVTEEPSASEQTDTTESTANDPETEEPETEEPETEEPVTEEPATEEPTDAPDPGEASTDEPAMLLPPETTNIGIPTGKPSDTTVIPPEEESTDDGSSGDSLIPPWLENLFPEMGDSSMGDGWFFLSAPLMSFFEKLPENEADSDEYPVKEELLGSELEELYKTKIIPSYIPSSGMSVDSTPADDALSEKYSVYYSEDRSRSFMSEEFTFDTENGGSLKIKVSNKPLSLYSSEKEYIENKSQINGVPVLLLSSSVLSKTVYLNAYFEKDGLYFRVTWQGKDLDEKEFIKMIESVM